MTILTLPVGLHRHTPTCTCIFHYKVHVPVYKCTCVLLHYYLLYYILSTQCRYRPIRQPWPVHPAGQLQVKFPARLIHWPPCSQTLYARAHSFTSTTYNKEAIEPFIHFWKNCWLHWFIQHSIYSRWQIGAMLMVSALTYLTVLSLPVLSTPAAVGSICVYTCSSILTWISFTFICVWKGKVKIQYEFIFTTNSKKKISTFSWTSIRALAISFEKP